MLISYQLLVDNAMLGIVKSVLQHTQDYGLLPDQALYVSFRTDLSGVILSNAVKKQYPQEITIALQHQYTNLLIYDEKFCVDVMFGGIPETIQVPFSALTGFADPLADFSLQFKKNIAEDTISKLHVEKKTRLNKGAKQSFLVSSNQRPDRPKKPLHEIDAQQESKAQESRAIDGNVISLEKFLRDKLKE